MTSLHQIMVASSVALVVRCQQGDFPEFDHFKLVNRGYQILNPDTGHVLPPSLNTHMKRATTFYGQPLDKEKVVFDSSDDDLYESIAHHKPNFPSYKNHEDEGHTGPETDPYFENQGSSYLQTSHQHTTSDYESGPSGRGSGFFNDFSVQFIRPSFDFSSESHHGKNVGKKPQTQHKNRYQSFDILNEYEVPSQPHHIFKKGIRKGSHFASIQSSIAPHKHRKKYPYYGRKRRSAVPWVILDPTTGRPTRTFKPQVIGEHNALNGRFTPVVHRRPGRRRPIIKNQNQLMSEETFNVIRSERNLKSEQKRLSSLYGFDGKGGEYFSPQSGIPLYKYRNKHPHGYGRKKRSAEKVPRWVILDPVTGREVEIPIPKLLPEQAGQLNGILLETDQGYFDNLDQPEKTRDNLQPETDGESRSKHHRKYPYRG